MANSGKLFPSVEIMLDPLRAMRFRPTNVTMINEAHKVTLVLDPDFGERLKLLASRSHVWAIDTLCNRIVAEEYWRDDPEHKVETGITIFQKYEDETLSQTCLRLLDIIETHHGEYSSDTPYSVLEIIGLPISEQIISALGDLGFKQFESKDGGFRFIRKQK